MLFPQIQYIHTRSFCLDVLPVSFPSFSLPQDGFSALRQVFLHCCWIYEGWILACACSEFMLHEGSMCLSKSGSGAAEAHGILLWLRKRRISPGLGWNTETIDDFDQLKAKMRNNSQSKATAAIPYTVICMWARWFCLRRDRMKDFSRARQPRCVWKKNTGV